MKRLAMVLMSGMLVAASLQCAAESCTKFAVEASVEVGEGELTLADLLTHGVCQQLRAAAAQVSLGAVPRPGSVRVLDGRRVRMLIEGLANSPEENAKEVARTQIPERIVVQRAGATMSCAEVAGFLASVAPAQNMAPVSRRWQQDLDCAGARGIPENAPLELMRTTRNAALERWEFALRCSHPEDCIPFLVWAHEGKTSVIHDPDVFGPDVQGPEMQGPDGFRVESSARAGKAGGSGAERLVKPGQTAILTWDQAGIRVVLPVTCLDAGALGQFVRVRFNNTARILRAEVVGEARLRASL